MNIKANGPWALLEVLDDHLEDGLRVSKGGLFLPEMNADERRGYNKARVVSMGSGVHNLTLDRRVKVDLEPGQIVWYRKYLGELNDMDDMHHQLELDGKHVFIHMDDILPLVHDGDFEGIQIESA